MANIMKAVQFMLDTAADDHHGYDQTHRNGPDYDCSSLVGTALNEAGFPVSRYSWTGNLLPQLKKSGFIECHEPWLPGDIHLKVGRHVCMSVSNSLVTQASINEKGGTTGGKTGDQTGREIWTGSYYNYPGGWDHHLRFVGIQDQPDPQYSVETIARQVVNGLWGNYPERKTRLEAAGYDYEKIRHQVNILCSNKNKKSNEEIAREVYLGRWGNFPERKTKLEAAGYDYEKIRALVNAMYG